MNDRNSEIVLKAHKHIDKKYYGTPSYLLRKHVVNTIASVLDKIENISFENLTSDNFYICHEVGFKYFSDKYRSALEFAKLQPERLEDQLYKMLRDLGRNIKKNNQLEEFFLFLSLFEENEKISETYRSLYSAYMDLLMEQTEFLKPDPFDKYHIVAGVTTDGDVLVTDDPFPNLDQPVYELVRSGVTGTNSKILFQQILKKYGYNNEDEFRYVNAASMSFYNNITLIVPYINEYTFDMLPCKAYAPSALTPLIRTNNTDFTDRLKNRRRTLPTNGAVVTVDNSIYLKKVTLKEVFHNNAIHMLCRMETEAGDVTVRYNTKTGSFFSPFNHIAGYCVDLHKSLKMLSLWFYTAYVCPDENILPTEEAYHNFTDDKNAALTFASIGGKLKSTIDRDINSYIDYDRYTEKTVSIAGFIRRLPEGQKASEEKRNMATLLGLSLADNETYVEPHNRKYWELKLIE